MSGIIVNKALCIQISEEIYEFALFNTSAFFETNKALCIYIEDEFYYLPIYENNFLPEEVLASFKTRVNGQIGFICTTYKNIVQNINIVVSYSSDISVYVDFGPGHVYLERLVSGTVYITLSSGFFHGLNYPVYFKYIGSSDPYPVTPYHDFTIYANDNQIDTVEFKFRAMWERVSDEDIYEITSPVSKDTIRIHTFFDYDKPDPRQYQMSLLE